MARRSSRRLTPAEARLRLHAAANELESPGRLKDHVWLAGGVAMAFGIAMGLSPTLRRGLQRLARSLFD